MFKIIGGIILWLLGSFTFAGWLMHYVPYEFDPKYRTDRVLATILGLTTWPFAAVVLIGYLIALGLSKFPLIVTGFLDKLCKKEDEDD